jgi:hypothetical protein
MFKFKSVFLLILFMMCSITQTSCSKEERETAVNTEILVNSMTIYGTDITNGGTNQFTVGFIPNNATNKTVSWNSSDLQIATVSEAGLVSAVSNGNVVITVSAQDGSGVSAQKTINISGVIDDVDGIIVQTSQEILAAIASAQAGDQIYIRGGNYNFSSPIQISGNGSNGNPISLLAYPSDDERPVFNFSGMSESSSNRGIELSGDYWHFYGIDVISAGDNGMHITGNNNLIEFCVFSENADTGLQLDGGASYNTILNCDSFYNADSSIENADGFACKLNAGTGNKFIGCRAWQNLDDGWDGYLRNTDDITTTYENCWAFKNGYLKNGTIGGGDGNGFKTGGSDDKTLKHNAIYKNCVVAGNVNDGFDHNSNRGAIEIYNASSFSNGRNYSFSSTNIASSLKVKNALSLNSGSTDSFNATNQDISNNGWQNGLVTNANDFMSIDMNLLTTARNSDGSLPQINFLQLVSTSDLIDQGVDVGLPFNGSAPDLGAFEFE